MLHGPATEHSDHHEEEVDQEGPLDLGDKEETDEDGSKEFHTQYDDSSEGMVEEETNEDEFDHESILTWEREGNYHSTEDPLLEIDSESDVQYPLFEQHLAEGRSAEVETSSSSPWSRSIRSLKKSCQKE